MNLKLTPLSTTFYYDELDTNAINFILEQGYFSIQTCVYLEEDDYFNLPYFEFNDQLCSQYGGIARIVFFERKIFLAFEDENLFSGKYKTVELHLNSVVGVELVDFFVNGLFIGDMVDYDIGFDAEKKIIQTSHRDYLAD